MKHLPSLAVLIAAVFTAISCSSESAHAGEPNTSANGAGKDDVLIVYLTRTQNTAAIAQIIKESVGGRLVEIEPQNPYPENYAAIVAQVDKENESGYLPALKTKIENIEDYETVFVGFPTWGMQLPPPMKAFLREHDLRGKTVIPFNTHGGYGAGSSFRTVEQLCPKSKVLAGFSTKGGLERDGIYLAIAGERREQVRAEVVAWLRGLRML